MPVYEYKCNDCKKTFIVTETFKAHEKHLKPKCTNCQSKNVDRLFTDVSVITSKKS